MRMCALISVLLSIPAFAEDWKPPEDPNPQAILREAQADVRAKRYEVALAKYVWFHENALSIQPAMYGVRLSFALGGWHELAKVYPPALQKLEDVRNETVKEVEAGKGLPGSFHDVAAINRTLREESRTVKLFESLDDHSPEDAKKVFKVAQPALIRDHAYKLCAKYLDPEKDFEQIKLIYENGKALRKDPRFGARHLEFANKKFANDILILVALLVLDDRKAAAEKIAENARAVFDDKGFHRGLEESLQGVVPDPWP